MIKVFELLKSDSAATLVEHNRSAALYFTTVLKAATPTTTLHVLIRPLLADEWPKYKSIRMRALESDPAPFSGTIEMARAYDDATWNLHASNVFLAFPLDKALDDGGAEAEEAIGVAGVVDSTIMGEASNTQPKSGKKMGEYVSVWVAPEYRGMGIALRLTQYGFVFAQQRRYQVLNITMGLDNPSGTNVYRRAGYGERRLDEVAECIPSLEPSIRQFIAKGGSQGKVSLQEANAMFPPHTGVFLQAEIQ